MTSGVYVLIGVLVCLACAAILPTPWWIPAAVLAVIVLAGSARLASKLDRWLREMRILRLAPALLGAKHALLDAEDLAFSSGLKPHTLYPTLGWMVRAGWLRSEGLGYQLTPLGRAHVAALHDAHTESEAQ